MIAFIKDIKKIIPDTKQKKLPFFFAISLLNSALDFISITLLAPFLLIVINKQKVDEFLKTYIDFQYENKHIFIALGLVLMFYFLKNFLQTKIVHKQSKYVYSIGTLLSKKLIFNYTQGNYEEFYKIDKGQLIRDFHKLPTIFVTNVLTPIYSILSELIILSMIVIAGVILKPKITLGAIVCIFAISNLLLYLRSKKTKYFNTVISNSYSETLNHLMNMLNGFIEIKSTNSETYFTEKFFRSNKEHNQTLAELSSFKQNNVKYLEIIIIGFLAMAIGFILINSWSFRDMIFISFFASAVIKIIPSFNKMINAYTDIKSNAHAVDILKNYSFDHTTSQGGYAFKEQLHLEHIDFQYANQNPILKNCNLRIQKGEFLSISGASGSGKTTLLHLISGVLPPHSGQIKLDQKVITNSGFLNFTYMLSQQPFIFQGTLLENIIMNATKAIDFERIHQLLEVLELQHWFDSLENGFETVLNLNSNQISGGQKQRIALLRALYAKPDILLLDEATNQLNPELETKVMQYLKKQVKDHKLTIVAVFHNHNLSSFADHHYYFENYNVHLR